MFFGHWLEVIMRIASRSFPFCLSEQRTRACTAECLSYCGFFGQAACLSWIVVGDSRMTVKGFLATVNSGGGGGGGGSDSGVTNNYSLYSADCMDLAIEDSSARVAQAAVRGGVFVRSMVVKRARAAFEKVAKEVNMELQRELSLDPQSCDHDLETLLMVTQMPTWKTRGLCLPRFDELTPQLLLEDKQMDVEGDENDGSGGEEVESSNEKRGFLFDIPTSPVAHEEPSAGDAADALLDAVRAADVSSGEKVRPLVLPVPPLASPPPPAPPTPPSSAVWSMLSEEKGRIPMPPLKSPPPPAPPTPPISPPMTPPRVTILSSPERIKLEPLPSPPPESITKSWDHDLHLLHRCVRNQRQELVEKLRMAEMALRQRERYLDMLHFPGKREMSQVVRRCSLP